MKALFLVVIFGLAGSPDEVYKEKIHDDQTPTQCTARVEASLPRLWKVYDGYKLKYFGCVSQDQLQDFLSRQDR